jgi:hypothetical protein
MERSTMAAGGNLPRADLGLVDEVGPVPGQAVMQLVGRCVAFAALGVGEGDRSPRTVNLTRSSS